MSSKKKVISPKKVVSEELDLQDIDVNRISGVSASNKYSKVKPYTLAELKEIGKALEIDKYYKMTKEELSERIIARLNDEEEEEEKEEEKINEKFLAKIKLSRVSGERTDVKDIKNNPYTLAEMKEIAKELNMHKTSKLTKEELAEAIRKRVLQLRGEEEEEEQPLSKKNKSPAKKSVVKKSPTETKKPVVKKSPTETKKVSSKKSVYNEIKVGKHTVKYNDTDISDWSKKEAVKYLETYLTASENRDELNSFLTENPSPALLALIIRRAELVEVVEQLEQYIADQISEDEKE